ncbi:hypothetical protein HN682_03305, partial [Candidatus Peregrinibacteria bacterium]|nr:hypothetical protein [Candidatus Peregrinibacteria bacterium]
YVGTIDRGQRHDNQQGMNGERAEEIIACTLYQLHPGIEIDDGNWNENAALIAEMRNEVESILDKYDAIIDTASKLTLASNDHTFNCDCSSCVSWEKLNELLVQDE